MSRLRSMSRSIDGWGSGMQRMKLRGRLWRAEAPKKGLDLVRIGEPMMIPPLHCASQIKLKHTSHGHLL